MPWYAPKKQDKQSTPTASIDVPPDAQDAEEPNRLWDQAFLKLGNDQPDLVRRYGMVLTVHDGAAYTGQAQLPPSQDEMSELVTKQLLLMNDRQWRVNLGKKSIEIRSQ